MKYLVVAVSVLTVLVNSKTVTVKNAVELKTNTAYGYLSKTGLQLANKIREAESQVTTIRQTREARDRVKRIVDGNVAHLGDVPYQAGIIIYSNGFESACSGSLLNSRRVITAAHCWFDGKDQADKLTVVLGSVKLYSGGTRMDTSKVVMHERYMPRLDMNDIAIVYLPLGVKFTRYIKPIPLPSGSERTKDFVGYTAVASGFGRTRDDDSNFYGSSLRYVKLKVITNSECSIELGFIPRTNICTVGHKRKNICSGDSGGALAIVKNNRRILIGVTSFGSTSCEDGQPSAYARVSSYVSWIKQYLS